MEWIRGVLSKATADGYLKGEGEERQFPMDALLDVLESDWLLGEICTT